jgi:hypothetical protein
LVCALHSIFRMLKPSLVITGHVPVIPMDRSAALV